MNIEWLLNKAKQKFYPITHAKAVLVGENNETLDTELDSIKNDLDTLEFGEVAGGKNLFKYNEVSGTLSKTVEYSLDAGTYTISALVNSSDTDSSTSLIDFYYEDGTNESYLLGRESRTSYTITLTKHVIALIFYASKDYANSANDTFTYSDIQIEKGTTATSYEPYIPSVKMLAEEVSAQNESLSVIGKCKNLLNPTLQTTTLNGVTCTNNGDGTYTLNGTASGLTTFILRDMKLDSSLSYKLTGCPLGGDWDNGYSMYVEKQYWGIDIGKGYEITLTDAGNICGVYIRIIKDTVCNNLVFKPMITTDLSATYDDFVPYTGEGETLTHDVAELKNDLMFKNVWSGEIYKANETATISNFSNSKKYLFEFKAKSNAYKQNVIVLGNQVYIEVPLIGHASTIAFTLYRLNISSNGVVTISDVINEDSGASLVNIYEI